MDAPGKLTRVDIENQAAQLEGAESLQMDLMESVRNAKENVAKEMLDEETSYI